MLYPKDWRREDAANGANVILFSNAGGFIQIVAQEKSGSQSIAQWYIDSNTGTAAPEVETLAGGLESVSSPDGLTFYLTAVAGGETVYVITYSPESSRRLEFMQTFRLLARSLSLP